MCVCVSVCVGVTRWVGGERCELLQWGEGSVREKDRCKPPRKIFKIYELFGTL